MSVARGVGGANEAYAFYPQMICDCLSVDRGQMLSRYVEYMLALENVEEITKYAKSVGAEASQRKSGFLGRLFGR